MNTVELDRTNLTENVDDPFVHHVEKRQKVNDQQSERGQADLILHVVREQLPKTRGSEYDYYHQHDMRTTHVASDQGHDLMLYDFGFSEQAFVDG